MNLNLNLCAINLKINFQAQLVLKMDNAIHQMNHYPAVRVVCFVNTYPLNSVLPVDSITHPLNNWGQVIDRSYIKYDNDITT